MNYHNLINDLAELEAEIRQALVSPDEIRRSSRDPNVLLFYLVLKERRWAVAVARLLNAFFAAIQLAATHPISKKRL